MKSWKREAVHTGRESQATIKSFGRNGAPTFLLSYAISRYFSRTTNFHELTFLEANSFSLAGRPYYDPRFFYFPRKSIHAISSPLSLCPAPNFRRYTFSVIAISRVVIIRRSKETEILSQLNL